jgi:hypothetical protein
VSVEDTIMQNLIRYLSGRLRGAVSDRRRAPRYEARLFFSVSILDENSGNGGTRQLPTLVGRTRDVSETGFALIVPSLSLGTGHLNDGNSTLLLNLDLPAGRIETHVVPVRSYQLGEKEKDFGFFVGAKITYMSVDARARYTGFLRGLRSPR